MFRLNFIDRTAPAVMESVRSNHFIQHLDIINHPTPYMVNGFSYAPYRSRSLRTPANMFIINLAVTDLLMCLTQSPIFFTTSMHKRWIFGEKGRTL